MMARVDGRVAATVRVFRAPPLKTRPLLTLPRAASPTAVVSWPPLRAMNLPTPPKVLRGLERVRRPVPPAMPLTVRTAEAPAVPAPVTMLLMVRLRGVLFTTGSSRLMVLSAVMFTLPARVVFPVLLARVPPARVKVLRPAVPTLVPSHRAPPALTVTAPLPMPCWAEESTAPALMVRPPEK